jgi:hypothetical protein
MKSPRQRRQLRNLAARFAVVAEVLAANHSVRKAHRQRAGRWAVFDGTLYIRCRSRIQARSMARKFGHGSRVVRHHREYQVRHVWVPAFVAALGQV